MKTETLSKTSAGERAAGVMWRCEDCLRFQRNIKPESDPTPFPSYAYCLLPGHEKPLKENQVRCDEFEPRLKRHCAECGYFRKGTDFTGVCTNQLVSSYHVYDGELCPRWIDF